MMRRLLTTLVGPLAISALLCLATSPVSAQTKKPRPEIFDVTNFGATGDCTTADTPAIQAAIDAAYVAGGGKVYLPRGCYRLDGTPAGAPQSLTIYGSNITFAGDGDATVLSVQKWGTAFTTKITDPITHAGFSEDIQAYIQIFDPRGPISNVRLEQFRFVGPSSCFAGSGYNNNSLNTMQLGGPSAVPSAVVSRSGFSDINVQHSCFTAFALNGGTNNPGNEIVCGSTSRDANGNASTPDVDCDNYIVNNRITDVAYEAINPFSGGHANVVVVDNLIDGTGGLAIEWASMRGLIANNIITNALGGAVAVEQAPTQTGWTTISDNIIMNVGKSDGTHVSPAIELGEAVGAFRVEVSGNVIRNAYGPGIVKAGGGTSDIIVENNTIDGFGVGGVATFQAHPHAADPFAWAGIWVINVGRSSRVVGNWVRCLDNTVDKCDAGVQAGGGNSVNSWADRNVVSGVAIGADNGHQPFLLSSSAGVNGAGTHGQPGSGIRIGTNIDLTTGIVAGPSDYTNTLNLPIIYPPTGNSFSTSVGGSNAWTVEIDNGTAATITELTNGSVGQVVTLVFRGTGALSGSCTIHNAPSATPTMSFSLNGDFVADTAPNQIPSLQLMWTPNGWVEVGRSTNHFP